MSKLFIVYRTNRADGQATAIREAIQSEDAQTHSASASLATSATSASTAMTPSTATGASS